MDLILDFLMIALPLLGAIIWLYLYLEHGR